MGKNVWRDEDEWPLARARSSRASPCTPPAAPTPHRRRRAGPRPAETGRLVRLRSAKTRSPRAVAACAATRPSWPRRPRPAPRRGAQGRAALHDARLRQGLRGHRPRRPPELYVSSTARDTDFTAKLVDVWPNGLAQNLTDGIVRARYRDSEGAPARHEARRRSIMRTIDLRARATSSSPATSARSRSRAATSRASTAT